MINHIFVLIRRMIGFIVFYLVDLLAIINSSSTVQQTLLIVRVDVLGDYILFRNFIKELRRSPQYKDYKITFCGNQALKEFIEFFDGEVIDDFIWLDRERFVLSIPYRFRMLRHISAKGFAVSINSQYSREFFHGDAIIRASKAVRRIGSCGDLNNMGLWQKLISDKYYTWLVPAEKKSLFEFYRNREFFENLLNTKISIKKPQLVTENIPQPALSCSNYVVIHPGARLRYRQWHPDNYAKIADFIYDEYGLGIVIVGSKPDIEASCKVMSSVSLRNVIDLTCKTDIIHLAKIISNAKLFIANDTGTAHVAAAVNTPVIVISNGNHFGRFVPYPYAVFEQVYAVFPGAIASRIDDIDYLGKKYEYCSDLDINEVTVPAVQQIVSKIIKVA